MAYRTWPMRAATIATMVCVPIAGAFAQTAIKMPKNKYTPKQDVEIGREAAAEVRKQYPIIEDAKISRYLSALGDRLVAAAPPELKDPAYEYSFTPVNLKEINAFALPGGPMFVHRGMFDAAASEGEVVGVMAHELSHVLLRHGTANATKAQNPWLQLGQIAGQIGGAVARRVARPDRRRVGRRADRLVHCAGQPVRPRHAADALQPRLREAGGPAGRADHGARRLRSALARAHVRDDRARDAGRREPTGDAQPTGTRKPHDVHHQGSRDVDRRD